MDIGIVYFPTDSSIDPVTLARETERLGFAALFVTEHTHMPVDHSPYPAGGPLPEQYRRTWDPFVALAGAAAVTETLELGTGICLVAQHDPIVLAKTVASLSLLSGGRVSLGVGAGWNAPEAENHGTPFAARFAAMREVVQAMRTIWTEEEASYHGQHVSFDPLWSWPKPVSPVPVLVGGLGPTVIDRVLEYGDAWMPILGRSPGRIAPRIADLRQRAATAGRPPIPVVGYWHARAADPGLRDAVAAAGVDRVLLELPEGDPEAALAQLRQWAAAFLG